MQSPEVSPALSDDVALFLQKHPDEVEVTPAGKLRFTLTGMEFPVSADMDALERYRSGRSMKRAQVQRANEEFDFDSLFPHIVPNKKKSPEAFLYCHLTKKTLPRDAEIVRKHINGRRYLAALKSLETLEKNRNELEARRAQKAAKAAAARKEGLARSGTHDSEEDASSEGNEGCDDTLGTADILGSGEDSVEDNEVDEETDGSMSSEDGEREKRNSRQEMPTTSAQIVATRTARPNRSDQKKRATNPVRGRRNGQRSVATTRGTLENSRASDEIPLDRVPTDALALARAKLRSKARFVSLRQAVNDDSPRALANWTISSSAAPGSVFRVQENRAPSSETDAPIDDHHDKGSVLKRRNDTTRLPKKSRHVRKRHRSATA